MYRHTHLRSLGVPDKTSCCPLRSHKPTSSALRQNSPCFDLFWLRQSNRAHSNPVGGKFKHIQAVYNPDQGLYRPAGVQRKPVTQQRPRQYNQDPQRQVQRDTYGQPWQEQPSNANQYPSSPSSQQYRPVRQEPFQNGQRSMLRQASPQSETLQCYTCWAAHA